MSGIVQQCTPTVPKKMSATWQKYYTHVVTFTFTLHWAYGPDTANMRMQIISISAMSFPCSKQIFPFLHFCNNHATNRATWYIYVVSSNYTLTVRISLNYLSPKYAKTLVCVNMAFYIFVKYDLFVRLKIFIIGETVCVFIYFKKRRWRTKISSVLKISLGIPPLLLIWNHAHILPLKADLTI